MRKVWLNVGNVSSVFITFPVGRPLVGVDPLQHDLENRVLGTLLLLGVFGLGLLCLAALLSRALCGPRRLLTMIWLNHLLPDLRDEEGVQDDKAGSAWNGREIKLGEVGVLVTCMPRVSFDVEARARISITNKDHHRQLLLFGRDPSLQGRRCLLRVGADPLSILQLTTATTAKKSVSFNYQSSITKGRYSLTGL